MHEPTEYITMTEAAQLAPTRPSANCVWRWCRYGVLARGGERVRMQHVRIGGKVFTTVAWLVAFGQALAEADANYFRLKRRRAVSPSIPRARTAKQRQAAIERAERELEAAGVYGAAAGTESP